MTFYRFFNLAGDNSKEATPDPIPNSEVKLFCVDGTARVTVWESRTSPAFFYDFPPIPLHEWRGDKTSDEKEKAKKKKEDAEKEKNDRQDKARHDAYVSGAKSKNVLTRGASNLGLQGERLAGALNKTKDGQDGLAFDPTKKKEISALTSINPRPSTPSMPITNKNAIRHKRKK